MVLVGGPWPTITVQQSGPSPTVAVINALEQQCPAFQSYSADPACDSNLACPLGPDMEHGVHPAHASAPHARSGFTPVQRAVSSGPQGLEI